MIGILIKIKFLLFIAFFNVLDGKSQNKNEVSRNIVEESLRSFNTYKYIPSKYAFSAAKGSNVLKIVDKTIGRNGRWAIRVDNAHAGAQYPHINVNPSISKTRDPHLKISSSSLAAFKGVNKVVKSVETVGKYLGPIATAVDSIRLGGAVLEDLKKGTPKNTLETTASIGGNMVGAYTGGYVVGSTGAYIGGAIGSIFGGVGAVPGAAIGGLVGTIGGAFTGGSTGSIIGQGIAKGIAEIFGW